MILALNPVVDFQCPYQRSLHNVGNGLSSHNVRFHRLGAMLSLLLSLAEGEKIKLSVSLFFIAYLSNCNIRAYRGIAANVLANHDERTTLLILQHRSYPQILVHKDSKSGVRVDWKVITLRKIKLCECQSQGQ